VNTAEELEGINSIDEFLHILTEAGEGEANSFTAKVVSDSLDRLFPDEEKIRNLMMVSNVTNWQMVHIIKSLHSAYYMGLHQGVFGRPSIYEKRLKIIEDFLRLRASINARGRKDIVESLKAIMLNELQNDASRIKRLLGKD
jgi:hypothetical protein